MKLTHIIIGESAEEPTVLECVCCEEAMIKRKISGVVQTIEITKYKEKVVSYLLNLRDDED